MTKSGVKNKWWLKKVASALAKERKSKSCAFCDEESFVSSSQKVEEVMHPVLRKLQKTNRFGNDIPQSLDIEYHVEFRSFRRGEENTALRNGVDRETIQFVHRWIEEESQQDLT